ncbi:hypothetical protein OP10G_4310 [Fimbriimonas ginsengisoli Gsoil 348]|uniref:Uncharacterized protein n=1 Tax=Fimbriimonas ginsengisoli Gsoil 348 TaxID=661478 RepID=A0A068NVX9_FIMGI|nr:hypothetical protein OP10G_4310 [Fimbriimonas ginsengisoli Gsoil 348]
MAPKSPFFLPTFEVELPVDMGHVLQISESRHRGGMNPLTQPSPVRDLVG